MRMNPRRFLDTHRPQWKKMEEYAEKIEKRGWEEFSREELWKLASLYRGISSHLAVARAYLPGTRILFYLNQLVGRSYNMFYRSRGRWRSNILLFFQITFPQTFQRNFRLTCLAAGIMGAAALLGWITTLSHPQVAGKFASAHMLEEVQQGRLWTDGLHQAPSSVLSAGISLNNIRVSFLVFAGGLLGGAGTIYLLFVNGLMLGVLFGYTLLYGQDVGLFEFVVAHGLLELTLICVCGGAGFNLARALLFPGSRSRALAFRQEGLEAVHLVLGSLPFFLIAGIVEGFVSPDPELPFVLKIALGVFILLTYLGYGLKYQPRPKRNQAAPLDELIGQIQPFAPQMQT